MASADCTYPTPRIPLNHYLILDLGSTSGGTRPPAHPGAYGGVRAAASAMQHFHYSSPQLASLQFAIHLSPVGCPNLIDETHRRTSPKSRLISHQRRTSDPPSPNFVKLPNLRGGMEVSGISLIQGPVANVNAPSSGRLRAPVITSAWATSRRRHHTTSEPRRWRAILLFSYTNVPVAKCGTRTATTYPTSGMLCGCRYRSTMMGDNR